LPTELEDLQEIHAHESNAHYRESRMEEKRTITDILLAAGRIVESDVDRALA